MVENSKLLQKGNEYFKSGDHARAQKVLEELLESEPKNIEALFLLANIFHMKGEIGKAIKAFNQVLAIDSTHTDAAISLSVLYNDIGRYEEGKKIFELTSERVKKPTNQNSFEDKHINKKFSQKHLEIADLYFSYNRFDEALFEYNKAANLDHENASIRVSIAKVYAKKGFVAKAFEELKKVKNEHPSFIPARIALGILYYGNGNVIEAQQEWNKILVLDPANSEAKMYLNLSKTASETSIIK